MRVAGDLVLGAEEKPPTQAKVSRLFSPKLSDWPPPIDSPARARDSRSAFTEYVFSMNGIRSLSRSFSNAANAGPCFGNGSRGPTSLPARPLGRTTIIGTVFLSAYRLSMITLATPPRVHSASVPPMPWRRYSTGYFFSLEYPGGV